ncbi:YfhO family protein [Candidatus Roizmanbacteria bacterium]|nr:YfhO family protein [Candidatus Roizmanbacteria bacterium]
MKKNISPPLIIIFVVLFFFGPFFVQGKLPIPSDTIIGLYHPFRDLYAKDYPNGIPYKNFLITDPVRQQYPWRKLAIEIEKKGSLPLWNSYSMSGTPLAGTLQGAVFYPLNIFLFVLPFSLGWSLLIVLQPLLAGSFLYFYLRNIKIHSLASTLGGITFAFSGFFVAWLEWGTIGHVALWLPLLLLSIDKLFLHIKNNNILNKSVLFWTLVFLIASTFSFLAGHLQIFFYIFIISIFYFFARWIESGFSKKIFIYFIFLSAIFLILTFVQWYPTLQFISQSARNIDQVNWQGVDGWFIPWQHLVQFVAPDFFGNPTTLNYWGTWNYGELVGYVGLGSLILALFSLIARRDKKTLFFGLFLFFSLLFSLPTIIAKLPYVLGFPFLSTAQPTRLLFIADFSLAVLAALGLDFFLRQKNKFQSLLPIFLIGIILGCLWIFIFQNHGENILVAKRNLYFPLIIFGLITVVMISNLFFKNKKINLILAWLIFAIVVIDLIRFGQKFTPFTNKEYLFPSTKIISFLQKDQNQFRIMATDSRILPPNFSTVYHLQSVGGYDPLYSRRYGELIAASERGNPDIHIPFGFNRIVNPANANSRIMDLLGVKYVLSFSELKDNKFIKATEEGQTKVYRNIKALPRAFFVTNVKSVKDKQSSINALFDLSLDLSSTAIIEDWKGDSTFGSGEVKIDDYSEEKIVLHTRNDKKGFLVLIDTFYPTWRSRICLINLINCVNTNIYLTDYNFRGIIVPPGRHGIVFYNSLL